MLKIVPLLFGGRRRVFTKVLTAKSGLPHWPLPEATVIQGETPGQAAARYFKDSFGIEVNAMDVRCVTTPHGEMLCVARTPLPFDARFWTRLQAEDLEGWRQVEDIVGDAWCNPQKYAARLAPLMFEARPLLKEVPVPEELEDQPLL